MLPASSIFRPQASLSAYRVGTRIADGDAWGDACDCAPLDPGAFAIPGGVGGMAWLGDRETIVWNDLAPLAGTGVAYDVVCGEAESSPVGTVAEQSILSGGTTPSVGVLEIPAAANTRSGAFHDAPDLAHQNACVQHHAGDAGCRGRRHGWPSWMR